ncbi:MAG: trigger factor [Oscillospiraceae bacterium]|nr:trigger factor [Oscillospiraceae bacterium]
MTVTNVEKKENSTVELTIEVGAEAFEAAVQKAYLKNRPTISIPGFRKGKAPRAIVEKLYGASIFYEDAINELYPAAYAEAVAEQKLDEVGYPKMEIVTVGKEGFTFKAIVSVRPEVKLGTYKGLSAPKTVAKVTEKDINEELTPYIARATRLVAVKRKAKKGDTAVIDFEGFMNGKPFEGGKGENYSLELGSGSFIPGFEEQLIGAKAGEEKELNLTFPEEYVADLAGKDVVFKVKVNEVKESVKPELDDEFAKDVSEFDTLEAFKKDLADKLTAKRTEAAQRDYEQAIIDQLIEKMTVTVPETMVDVQVDRMMDDFANRVAAQGMDFNQYLQMMGMNADMMRMSARPNAEKQVKVELALDAVAAAEKLEVSDEDAEAELKRLAEQYSMELDKVKSLVPAEELKKDLLKKKASDFVFANAKVKAAAKKAAAKTEEPAAEAAEAKPAAKKTSTAKKTTAAKADEAKPAAKKTTTAKKTTAAKADEAKPAAKKTTTAKKPAAKKTEE